jgi:hypothetical protein
MKWREDVSSNKREEEQRQMDEVPAQADCELLNTTKFGASPRGICITA